MSRTMDSGVAAALAAGTLVPAFFAMLTFRSGVEYVWTGPGPITVDGQTYTGVGSLASVGPVSEGVDIQAIGTTLTLSGIDPALLEDSMNDIKSGAEAKVWIGAFSGRALIGRYLLFDGVVDKPAVSIADGTLSISLALESRLLDMARAIQRRYTAGDQNVQFPTDMAFNWVEIQNDISLNWGS